MKKRKKSNLIGVEKGEERHVWGHVLKVENSMLLHIAVAEKRAGESVLLKT